MLGFLFFLGICFFIFVSYLIGGIPFGLLLTRLKNKDLSKLGSGNIGATNVARQTNGKLAALTLLLDLLKGYFAVVFSVLIFHLLIDYDYLFFSKIFYIAYISMFFVTLGHCFSPYLKFKGGKGISTAAGTILAMSPSLFLLVAVVFFFVFLIFRIVSLASLIAAGFAAVFAFLPWLDYYYLELINAHYLYFVNIQKLTATYIPVLVTSIFLLVTVILIIMRHKTNITRLASKKERIFQVGKDSLDQSHLNNLSDLKKTLKKIRDEESKKDSQ